MRNVLYLCYVIIDCKQNIKHGIKSARRMKVFLEEYVVPYLLSMGYEKVSPRFSMEKKRFRFVDVYCKDDIIVYIGKRHFNRLCYIIVAEDSKIIGTIVYEYIYPEYFFHLFQLDFFGLFNKELADEIKEITRFTDYYQTTRRRVFRWRTVPRGTNYVSRRVFYLQDFRPSLLRQQTGD